MPAFDPAAWQRADFRLLRKGFVHLYWKQDVLTETTRWFEREGYDVIVVDALGWSCEADMHDALASALGFPEYYGQNLAALNDCLSDVVSYEYGSSANDTGLVLVLDHFDGFASKDPQLAQALLDIFASQARSGALIGHRMLCLVQSDDPDIRFEPVGASPVTWNPAEWLDSKRHP